MESGLTHFDENVFRMTLMAGQFDRWTNNDAGHWRKPRQFICGFWSGLLLFEQQLPVSDVEKTVEFTGDTAQKCGFFETAFFVQVDAGVVW